MSADLSTQIKGLRDVNCFSEKCVDQPLRVLDVHLASEDEHECSTDQELERLLTQDSLSGCKARVYSISQVRSFGPLYATEVMFKRIMETHDVMAEFCELVSCFHHMIDRTGDAYCGPQLQQVSTEKSEFAYIFKYPESNGRTDGADPWSLRQTAVYYQYNHQTQQGVWILINPRPRAPAWPNLVAFFTHARLEGASTREQLGGHKAIMSSYIDNWKQYLLHYEGIISNMSRNLLGTKIRHTIDLDYDTLGTVRYTQSRCLPLKSIFSSYRRGLNNLSNLATSIATRPLLGSQNTVPSPAWITTYEQKLAAYQDQADSLMSHCEFAAQLLRDRLDFKDQQVLREQSGSVLEMTKLTVEDSATVKVITVIGLGYLSFTVVATILELPFFHLEHGSENLEISPQLWIYVLVSVPLTLLTICYWRIALWLTLRERQKRKDENDLA